MVSNFPNSRSRHLMATLWIGAHSGSSLMFQFIAAPLLSIYEHWLALLSFFFKRSIVIVLNFVFSFSLNLFSLVCYCLSKQVHQVFPLFNFPLCLWPQLFLPLLLVPPDFPSFTFSFYLFTKKLKKKWIVVSQEERLIFTLIFVCNNNTAFV